MWKEENHQRMISLVEAHREYERKLASMKIYKRKKQI